jgi:hypothetical protein
MRATKARDRPLGDQANSVTRAGQLATTTRSPPPATGRTQIWARPSTGPSAGLDASANHRPSGDHSGNLSSGPAENGRAGAWPSVFASHTRERYRLPSRSTSDTVNATIFPSCETRVSSTSRSAPISSGLMPLPGVSVLSNLASSPSTTQDNDRSSGGAEAEYRDNGGSFELPIAHVPLRQLRRCAGEPAIDDRIT